ncbi:hypothetical protein [Priestia megaterium]|uniref:hypothetical protein n=1 Tax=Priestia megaterium TaxID=1404 RepID=UPI001404B721|nr:hypothetical protein [Priestia megaterium]MCM3183793.1 hypothetical protein [Priestia megaterium]MCM3192273.1 hypothetical protein [Priestia megaterium]MED3913145.1 hypothetical protein [Priestia megaterium]
MIEGQGEDSCGKSETPQELKRRGGSSAAPRKSTAVGKAVYLIGRLHIELIL